MWSTWHPQERIRQMTTAGLLLSWCWSQFCNCLASGGYEGKSLSSLTTFQLLICSTSGTQWAFTWPCCVNDFESSASLQAQPRLRSSPAKQELILTHNLGWLLENPHPTLGRRGGLWVLRQPLAQDSILKKACSPSGSEVFPPVSWAGTRDLPVLSMLRFLMKSASARMAVILSHLHLWHVKLLSGFGGLWGNTNLQTQSCAKFLKSKNLICASWI